jgi:formylmethanofuran dehydrogenase subunit E
MKHQELWDRCVAFHGHSCGGLAIGFQAALYAMELLDIQFSEDEEIVCVSENDACGVDAIQVLLGCSAGKGNLIFRLRGKQAFSIFNRTNGKSVRLVLKERARAESREKGRDDLLATPYTELFEVKTPSFELPEEARLFPSYPCECCGEMTAEYMLRLDHGKKLCLDCFNPYERLEG